MRWWTIAWLIAPALAGVCGYLVVTGRLQGPWSANDGPRIEYPTELDLGEHEIGDLVVAHYTIANQGNRDLLIDQVHGNCSCSGLEREQDGRYLRLESLRIAPKERADLVLRVSVRGVPVGATMVNRLNFRTNDPARPTAQIVAQVRRVSGGILTLPGSLVIGTVPLGAQVRQVVEVWDNAVTPRAIRRVNTNCPDRLKVRLLPSSEEPSRLTEAPEGVCIGRLEVVVDTSTAGDINALVEIHVAERSPKVDTLAVTGRIVAPIEILPSSLMLPRSSLAGPVYSAACICRSINDKPITVTLGSLPPGITVSMIPQSNPSLQAFEVKCDPDVAKSTNKDQRYVVRFNAKAGQDDLVLELPLIVCKEQR